MSSGYKLDKTKYANIPCLRFAMDGLREDFDGLTSQCHAQRDRNAFVNFVYGKSGDTPLLLAARYGHSAMLEYLLDNSANTEHRNIDGKTALHDASQNGNLECVDILLAREVEVDALKRADWTPLMLACAKSHVEVADRLLKAGAKITRTNKDGWNAFHLVVREGNLKLLNHLFAHENTIWKTKSNNGRTPLHTAAMHGHLDVVEFLLESCSYGVDDKDSCGSTPLMDALRFGHIQIADLLLKKQKADLSATDALGRTCIHLAAQAGQNASIQYLISEHNCDPNAQSTANGMAPLHFAAKEGHTSSMLLFISCGANPNMVDYKQRSALHYSAASGRTEIVRILLFEYSVAADKKDAFGHTAQELALRPDIRELFHQQHSQ